MQRKQFSNLENDYIETIHNMMGTKNETKDKGLCGGKDSRSFGHYAFTLINDPMAEMHCHF